MAVVAAQLVERWVPKPEILGSSPVIGKFNLLSTVFKLQRKYKNEEKEAADLLKKVVYNRPLAEKSRLKPSKRLVTWFRVAEVASSGSDKSVDRRRSRSDDFLHLQNTTKISEMKIGLFTELVCPKSKLTIQYQKCFLWKKPFSFYRI